MGVMLGVAALWGLAEATLFFFVPDVWISFVAVRLGWRPALFAACLACAGAFVGGAVMYVWGSYDPVVAPMILTVIPAISPAMVEMAGEDLREHGLIAMLTGAFTGVPFKIYAVEAGVIGSGLISFLMVAIVARLARFILAALIAATAAQVMRRFFSEPTILGVLSVFWIVFYAWYFMIMN
jgi:membrane protein YqaA with SNARE-associated domain